MDPSSRLGHFRAALEHQLEGLRRFGWRAFAADAVDGAVRGVMAGLSARELRAILRDDPPTERPNPRYKAQVKSFLLHIRPKYYQRASTWLTHTWRLGWFAVFFFLVEVFTGVVLMIFYAPTPQTAYNDMLHIMGGVPFGLFMRDMHRLGAEGMVAVVVLHMVRVYFTGSYKGPRRFTWVTGVILLLVTLVLSFSGYLLPWDQLAYWAVTIGTSMAASAPLFGEQVNLLLRGAPDIWADGLLRFYLLHVLFLPLLAILFISVHYYKVAREHSISLPAVVEEGDMEPQARRHAEERIDLLPNLLLHELMLASVALLVMVAAVATFFHAPLESHADPQVTPLHTKAPWYFLWLQGLLKLGDPALMGIVVPTIIFAVLFAVPWLDRNPHRLASRRKVAIAMGLSSTVAVLILSYMGTPGFGIETPAAQNILSHYVPDTHPGPVRETPWDQIATGPDGSRKTYFVSYPQAWAADAQYADPALYEFVVPPAPGEAPRDAFHELLLQFQADVENEPTLMAPLDGSAPLAMVTVESFTPQLKWIAFTINWDEVLTDVATGQPVTAVDPATGQPVVLLKRDQRDDGRPEQQVKKLALHRDANYRH